MHDRKRASPGRRHAPEATDPPAARRAWAAPRAYRFATSAAEGGGDTSVDGIELLS